MARRRIVVATLGDSITAGSPAFDPDPAIQKRLAGGLNTQSQYQYWATRLDPTVQFLNCGVYGERTDEILDRLEGCIVGADVLVVQGGINNIAQGRSVEDAAADLRFMIQRGKELGRGVALVDVLPWNNGYPRMDPEIRRLNALIARIAQEESVLSLPFHDTLEDEARPGRMRDEWTSDGDHPSVEGYRRLGELAFRLP